MTAAKPKDSRRYYERARDSITGKFVSLAFAREHPATTEITRVKRPPAKLH